MATLVVLGSLVLISLAGSGLLHRAGTGRQTPPPLLVLTMPLSGLALGAWAILHFAYQVCWITTPAWDYRLGIALVAGMGAVVVAALGLALIRLAVVWRLVVRSGPPIPPALQRSVAAIADRCGIVPPDVHLLAPARPLAFVCAWPGGRSRLFLSAWLLLHLDDRELEGVLAHELAHIRRRDHRMIWPAVLLRDAFCYLPSSRDAYRQLQRRQESACDALAADLTGRPLALASALAKVWQATLGPRGVMRSGVGLTGGHADLERRIRRLMAGTPLDDGGANGKVAGAVGAVLGLGGLQAVNVAVLLAPMGCGSLLRVIGL